MITLIIKGGLHAAHDAAQKHGVKLVETTTHNRFAEVIASTKDENLALVTAWFCEPPNEAPYPAGALMFYSQPQGAENVRAD